MARHKVMSLAEWPRQLCLRTGASAPWQGHLSDDPNVEAVLQRFLVYGPAVVLLLVAPIRIAQLYRAKLVVLPNTRGYLKAVSTIYGRPASRPG